MSQAVINPNTTLTILPAAVSTMCAYPLAKVRSDMGIQEYIQYKNDWYFFNTVWTYNYTVSTLNGGGRGAKSNLDPYQFMSNGDYISYINGQSEHIEVYPTPVGQFNNIF